MSDLLRSIRCDVQNPLSCWKAVHRLWPLSPWLMKDEYLSSACNCPASSGCPQIRTRLEQFAQHVASLAQGKGCCHILFAVLNKDMLQESPYLRNSFALPLIWKSDTPHSPELPAGLHRMATKIVNQINPPGRWGLAWNFEDSGIPISFDIELDYESGWASLAASLLLAIEGGTPDPTVWTSAAWDEVQGVKSVDGLQSKIETVYDLGGRKLFVPAENLNPAREVNANIARARGVQALEVRNLHPAEMNLAKALSPYLLVLDVPPARSAPLEERCKYHIRQYQRDRKFADDYYMKNMLEDLATKCRQEGIQGMPETTVENLITFVSLNTGASLMFTLLRPKRVLVFFTEQSRRLLAEFEKRALQIGTTIDKEFLNLDDSEAEEDRKIRQSIQSFLEKYGAGRTAIDVTPGPKNFSVMATWTVDPESIACLYIAQSWDKTGKPITGTERIRRLIKSSDKVQ